MHIVHQHRRPVVVEFGRVQGVGIEPPDLGALLKDPNTYFYVCGLKSMEEGVVLALREVAQNAGLDWASLAANLQQNGRLHLETY